MRSAMARPQLPVNEEIATLREKAQLALEETYANLDPWQKTQSRGIPSARIRSTISAS